jgi:hypothetical protein
MVAVRFSPVRKKERNAVKPLPAELAPKRMKFPSPMEPRDGTIPLSQANNVYERSMRVKFEKEKRLRKMKQAALPVFCTTTIPLLVRVKFMMTMQGGPFDVRKKEEYNSWCYEFPYSRFSGYYT